MKPPRNHVAVSCLLHVNDLMTALREATINREDFNSDPWSLWDAECLEQAATLIRTEIMRKGGNGTEYICTCQEHATNAHCPVHGPAGWNLLFEEITNTSDGARRRYVKVGNFPSPTPER